jgi:hypothetical protein
MKENTFVELDHFTLSISQSPLPGIRKIRPSFPDIAMLAPRRWDDMTDWRQERLTPTEPRPQQLLLLCPPLPEGRLLSTHLMSTKATCRVIFGHETTGSARWMIYAAAAAATQAAQAYLGLGEKLTGASSNCFSFSSTLLWRTVYGA